MFSPHDDPGPSFAELLRRVGLEPPAPPARLDGVVEITHGTTVVAIRYADGVVMAGDRRATGGNLIAHRAMEKVFAADRHTGVAIAGAAGPAMDMVKLFQLQLEHYEKVEGLGPQPRRQGQPALDHGALQPASRHAGPGRGAPVRRLRPGPRRRPLVPVRRDRWPLRGEQLRLHRLGQPARRHRGQVGLPRGPDPRSRPRPGHQCPVHRRRRGLGHRRTRPGPGHLPDHGHHHGRRLRAGGRGRGAERFGALVELLAAREATTPPLRPETSDDSGDPS